MSTIVTKNIDNYRMSRSTVFASDIASIADSQAVAIWHIVANFMGKYSIAHKINVNLHTLKSLSKPRGPTGWEDRLWRPCWNIDTFHPIWFPSLEIQNLSTTKQRVFSPVHRHLGSCLTHGIVIKNSMSETKSRLPGYSSQ